MHQRRCPSVGGGRVAAEALEHGASGWVGDRAVEARVKPTGGGLVLRGDKVGAAACGIAALLATCGRRREGVASGAVVDGLHVMKVVHKATVADVAAESCVWHKSVTALTAQSVHDAAGEEVGRR